MPSSGLEGEDKIPAGLLKQLERDEPEAWFEFFRQVHPSALAAIEQALTVRDSSIAKEAHRLVRAFTDDPVGLHGALETAWDSFRGHFLRRDRPVEAIRTVSEFAAWLIGVAYNRWQRERYREVQTRRQIALGAAAGPDGVGTTLLERHADPADGPEVEVDLADFRRALEEELRTFTRHLTDADRRIIRLSFFEGKNPREIKALVGVSISKCEEVPRLWLRHLAQRFPFTLEHLRHELDPR